MIPFLAGSHVQTCTQLRSCFGVTCSSRELSGYDASQDLACRKTLGCMAQTMATLSTSRQGGHRFSTRANGQARGLTPGREPGRPQGRERKNVLAGIIIPNDDRTLSPITNVSTATVRAGGADLGTCTNTWDHAIGLRGGGLPGILSSLSKRKEMWLEAAEFVLAWLDLATPALQHMWNVFRALFGLSLLFYGTEFATLAFHVIVFRLSGWKKVSPPMRPGKQSSAACTETTGCCHYGWMSSGCCVRLARRSTMYCGRFLVSLAILHTVHHVFAFYTDPPKQCEAQAARYKDELVTYYKDARQAMRRAAADIRVAADTSRRKKLKASLTVVRSRTVLVACVS